MEGFRLPPRQYLTATMFRKVRFPHDLDLGSSETLLVLEQSPEDQSRDEEGKIIFLGSPTKVIKTPPGDRDQMIKFRPIPDEEDADVQDEDVDDQDQVVIAK